MIEGYAFDDGVNENGAVVDLEDAQESYKTLIGKPLRILPNDYKLPTGHGYNVQTNSFSEKVINIGYIHNALLEEKTNKQYQVKFQAVMWKEYFPEIAENIMNLYRNGKLFFSVEFSRNIKKVTDGIRHCKDINFLGLSLVENPAWKKSKSIYVAEKLKERGIEGMTLEEALSKIKELERERDSYKEKNLKLEENVLSLKTEKVNNEGTIKQLKDSISEYEATINEFKTEKLSKERQDKLKELGFEGDVEGLGELTGEAWIEKLEKAYIDFSKALKETQTKKEEVKNDNNTITGLFAQTKKEDNRSNSEKLLSLLSNVSEEN